MYQCTTTRHGPLCRRSSARIFFRVQQVARVMSICPTMRLGRLRARIQVFAPIAHCALSQYLWGNHGYNGLKKYLQQASEAALEWETNEARKGMERCRHIEETTDLPGGPPLITRWLTICFHKLRSVRIHPDALCCSEAFGVGNGFLYMFPDVPREPRNDRFDQETFNPIAEGNLTRWWYGCI